MTEKPLVSVITPSYNCGKYLHHLFDSILNQTYKNIEFLFVDDGSTDNTLDVVNSYLDSFKLNGIKFKYLKKENGGVASAVNVGLANFTGEYLTWPDSDDWFTNDCIEKKVAFLEQNKDLGIVISQLYICEENRGNNSLKVLKYKNTTQRNIFEDLIHESGVYYAPVGFMIRSKMFLDVCPSRQIYDSNRMGQNWQMMLPICYKYTCGFIEEPLGYYMVRDNSLSHSDRTLQSRYDKSSSYLELKIHALESVKDLNEGDLIKYKNIINNAYLRNLLGLASQMHDKEKIKYVMKGLQESGQVKLSDRIKYVRGISVFVDILFRILYYPVRLCKSLLRRIKRI